MTTTKNTKATEIGKNLGEAGGELAGAAKAAAENTADYLTDGWEEVKEGGFAMKDSMIAGYEKGLQVANEHLSEWKRGVGDGKEEAVARLRSASERTERELEKLKVAGESEWENARHSLNEAWSDLKRGIIEARQTFNEKSNS